MTYDYIIIGAGLGGISAGLNLARNHKKVLILEKNSLPGGLSTTIKRGRFEFDTDIYDFYDYGTKENKGLIQKIFDEYGLDIEVDSNLSDVKIKILDSKEEFLFSKDGEAFLKELEKMREGSAESFTKLVSVMKEIQEGLIEIEKGNLDIENKYPHFIKYIDSNAYDALQDLKIPKELIHYLSYLWISLGSPLDKLSFIDYASFMYKFLFKKVGILKRKNIDLIAKMVARYQDLNGKIYYRSYVSSIKDNGLFKVVTTKDGKEYKAREVICDLSQRYVYQRLINEENKDVHRLENSRTLASNGIMVFLGLNKNYEYLGLKHHHYYSYQNINSMMNVKKMNTLKHSTWEAIVPNVVNPSASPYNTTILVLKTLYFGDAFAKVNKTNYLKMKEELAKDLIEQFENTFGIDITEYIEEVEILTPLDLAEVLNRPNGSMLGYMRKGYDNAIHRILTYEDEKVPNISFVGHSSLFGAGADNAIHSGYYVTQKLMEKEEVNNNGEQN